MEETSGWQYFVATGGLVLVKHSDDSPYRLRYANVAAGGVRGSTRINLRRSI